MSWWKKLLGRSAEHDTAPRFPVTVELVPGKLSVRVHLHELRGREEPISCWSYVTDGLAAHEQKELVFTLRRYDDEAAGGFPAEPLELLPVIYELAASGRRVDAGGVTELGGKRLFGRHIVYTRAQRLPGVALPASCLAGVLVTDEELRGVREFGMLRVLARMGEAARYFPFPPWANRRGRGLSLERTFEHSLLSKLPRSSSQLAWVSMHDKRITLSRHRSELPEWKELHAQLAPNQPFALLTWFNPAANGYLVWKPGQTEPSAIAAPDSEGMPMGGCFVAFLPDQPADRGRMLEDGYLVELTTGSSQAVRSALLEGKDIEIPGTADSMTFALTWRNDAFVSPIDGRTYVAEGGWVLHQPDRANGDDTAKAGKVKLQHIQLLMSDAEIEARTTAEDLSAFILELQGCAERALGELDGALEAQIRMTCTPSGHSVQLAHRGGQAPQALQALHKGLRDLAKLPVRSGEVAFEVRLTVSP